METSCTPRANPAQRSRIPGSSSRSPGKTRQRRRKAAPTGRIIIIMGNQLSKISPAAISPKAPATMAILVMEKMVKKVLKRW